jgi:hypothetical protein
MNKITVNELLTQYGLTWYGLHKRGAGSKSMCHDWVRGKHLPSTRSAAKIARAIGLPLNYILATLRTRNSWENSPRVPWGTHVREALEASSRTEIKDRLESEGPWCITCHQKLENSANRGDTL